MTVSYDFACESLFQGLTFASFLLERCLSHLHSSLQSSLHSFKNINGKTTSTTDRAWWNTNKGSAVVVWAPGDQTISQALSLSLASIHARPGSSRVGRPPYTVIVIIPSASKGLSSLISAWATRKASLETGKESSRGRGKIASWNFFGFGSVSFRLGSPESSEGDMVEAHSGSEEAFEGEEHQNKEIGEAMTMSNPRNAHPGKRRNLSFGRWSTPDVVGYGMDMLKGLRIGQSESPGIGAIIPVVADTSTPDGISQAHSTIRAYCTSHDLLLRALVIMPSIMSNAFISTSSKSPFDAPGRSSREAKSPSSSRSREVTKILERDELLYQSQASGTSSLSAKSLHNTQTALSTDVGETMSVVASLFPALKSDGGRVVAVVPSAFRNGDRGRDDWEHLSEKTQDEDDDSLEFHVTRKALLEMWSVLQRRLSGEGIQVSQIHMSAPGKQQRTTHQRGGSRLPRLTKKDPTRLQHLLQQILYTAHFILYPVPQLTKPQKPYMDSNRNMVVPTMLEDHDSTDACPSLLLDAVRSVLVRSWPRAHYSVGLGPRLEVIWECLPGHNLLEGWISESLFT